MLLRYPFFSRVLGDYDESACCRKKLSISAIGISDGGGRQCQNSDDATDESFIVDRCINSLPIRPGNAMQCRKHRIIYVEEKPLAMSLVVSPPPPIIAHYYRPHCRPSSSINARTNCRCCSV